MPACAGKASAPPAAAPGRDQQHQQRAEPLLHAVYRIPGHEKDQIRASLTKSYKAANIQDLIALPSSRLNSATRPDRTGNPNLKPELATGLDVAYEHYLGRAGILSASGFIRNIEDLIRRDITLQDTSTGPRWVSTPRNIGHARTKGIELEAKFQLQELVADAPAIDSAATTAASGPVWMTFPARTTASTRSPSRPPTSAWTTA
jgi:iron complex outermembrane receptor protein